MSTRNSDWYAADYGRLDLENDELKARLAECEQISARIASERACLEIDCLNLRAEVARLKEQAEKWFSRFMAAKKGQEASELGAKKAEAELAALRERDNVLSVIAMSVLECADKHGEVRYERLESLRDALGR